MPETINAMQASAAALGIFLLNTEAMPSPTSQRPSRTLQTCTALFSAKPVCAGTKAFDQLSLKKVALCFFEDNLGISHDAKTHVIDFSLSVISSIAIPSCSRLGASPWQPPL
ncbi:hypothetical protein [Janthinobacterium sp. 61]|uniref:hypothetical protein n=1 Tax=Janthinobacterium sp. 61 TaxID=2035209 RepID=UPI0015D5C91B|nr:hypothetical protein [Janthinobacterium sp. 61]